MATKEYIAKVRRRKALMQNISRGVVNAFVWMGMAVLYYVAFSFFFDTPFESQLKHSTDKLRQQYEALNARYDSLGVVLDNVVERDKNVFRMLFESDPYDFDQDNESKRWQYYETLLQKTTPDLQRDLADRLTAAEENLLKTQDSYDTFVLTVEDSPEKNNIPSIQPVVNKDLTLLTASYGMRINPFRKKLQSHQGVDYTLAEGSRVFATADGVVVETSEKNSTSGQSILLDHGNGYRTSYSHLSKIMASKGQRVSRGDVIALSGNTGLSLAPHLHYEVRYNDMRIDPVHYFFMELTPEEYERIMRIAQSGMQSFD